MGLEGKALDIEDRDLENSNADLFFGILISFVVVNFAI